MKIGVVIPTLNSASTLSYTLNSLIDQVGLIPNILVVDGGSSDKTLDVCAKFEVPSVFVEKGNIYKAINYGLNMLHCDWITYINSDDVVYRDSYYRLIKRGEEADATIVYGDCWYIDINNRNIASRYSAPVWLAKGLLKRRIMPFAQPSSIFRRDLFLRQKGFNEKFRMAADLDFFGRAAAVGERFARLPIPIAEFRLHSSQLSARMGALGCSELDLVGFTGDIRSRVPSFAAHWLWRLQNTVPLFCKLLTRQRKKWSSI